MAHKVTRKTASVTEKPTASTRGIVGKEAMRTRNGVNKNNTEQKEGPSTRRASVASSSQPREAASPKKNKNETKKKTVQCPISSAKVLPNQNSSQILSSSKKSSRSPPPSPSRKKIRSNTVSLIKNATNSQVPPSKNLSDPKIFYSLKNSCKQSSKNPSNSQEPLPDNSAKSAISSSLKSPGTSQVNSTSKSPTKTQMLPPPKNSFSPPAVVSPLEKTAVKSLGSKTTEQTPTTETNSKANTSGEPSAPPDLTDVKVMCFICGMTAKGMDIVNHLFFNSLKCENCCFKISTCIQLKYECATPSNCSMNRNNPHTFSDWQDPIKQLSYNIRRNVAIENYCRKNIGPLSSDEISLKMKEYMIPLLRLRELNPWKSAIKAFYDLMPIDPTSEPPPLQKVDWPVNKPKVPKPSDIPTWRLQLEAKRQAMNMKYIQIQELRGQGLQKTFQNDEFPDIDVNGRINYVKTKISNQKETTASYKDSATKVDFIAATKRESSTTTKKSATVQDFSATIKNSETRGDSVPGSKDNAANLDAQLISDNNYSEKNVNSNQTGTTLVLTSKPVDSQVSRKGPVSPKLVHEPEKDDNCYLHHFHTRNTKQKSNISTSAGDKECVKDRGRDSKSDEKRSSSNSTSTSYSKASSIGGVEGSSSTDFKASKSENVRTNKMEERRDVDKKQKGCLKKVQTQMTTINVDVNEYNKKNMKITSELNRMDDLQNSESGNNLVGSAAGSRIPLYQTDGTKEAEIQQQNSSVKTAKRYVSEENMNIPTKHMRTSEDLENLPPPLGDTVTNHCGLIRSKSPVSSVEGTAVKKKNCNHILYSKTQSPVSLSSSRGCRDRGKRRGNNWSRQKRHFKKHEENESDSDNETKVNEKYDFVDKCDLETGRFMVVEWPKQSCPEECPLCYCALDAQMIAVRYTSKVMNLHCPDCHLTIYIRTKTFTYEM